MGKKVTNKYYDKTLCFNCSDRKKCLALTNIKRKIPWITHNELTDGSTILSGRPVRYNRIRNIIKKYCALCKKINGR